MASVFFKTYLYIKILKLIIFAYSDESPYPKNKKRGQWKEGDMHLALAAVASKNMSIRKAEEFYGIPPSSIQDWKKQKTKSKRVGHQTYLTEVEELVVVNWCLEMQEVALCVTLNMLKYTIQAILHNAPRQHPFRDGIPGNKWWALFKKRHLEIVLRCASGLEVKRALGFTKKSTTAFYDLLETIYNTEEYHPSHIWNVDETGVCAAEGNLSIKVIARKGSKAVRQSNVDNKEWMSIMACINTVGPYISNLYIFKRKTKPLIDYICNCEVGAVMAYQQNGYMTIEIFLEWLLHFKNNVPGGITKENKHLLILDGHASHVTNEAIQFGIENSLDILILPSHCSHEMQPLDFASFHPFKLNLAMEKIQKMRKTPHWAEGATMKSNLVEMSAQALAKALKPQSIKSGFSVTGIFPLNKAAMDAKLGPDFQLETENEILAQQSQGEVERLIPDIFSQLGFLPTEPTMPGLFPELHLSHTNLSQLKLQSYEQMVPNSQNENVEDLFAEVLEFLSQLSLLECYLSQGVSSTYSSSNISNFAYKCGEEVPIDLTREIPLDYQGWYNDYMEEEESLSIIEHLGIEPVTSPKDLTLIVGRVSSEV